MSQGAAALENIRAEFMFVGRPFICGEQLTAADITFVALALPVLGVHYATVGLVSDPSIFTPLRIWPQQSLNFEPMRVFFLHVAERFAFGIYFVGALKNCPTYNSCLAIRTLNSFCDPRRRKRSRGMDRGPACSRAPRRAAVSCLPNVAFFFEMFILIKYDNLKQ